MTARIYVASKSAHGAMWRDLRDKGWPIVSTWIDESEPGQTADMGELYERCLREVQSATALVVARFGDEILKGALIETGAALAAGVPVLAVNCDEFSFTKHRLVTRCFSVESALMVAAGRRMKACIHCGTMLQTTGEARPECGTGKCSKIELPRPPIRIRRRRTKGWRMPPNTVCVTRPGKWGNPLTIGFGRAMLTGPVTDDWEVRAARVAVDEFRRLLEQGGLRFTVDDARRELRGKDLACWCPIGSPCHADVLLEIANSDDGGLQ